MKFKITFNRNQRAFYTIMWERIRTGQYPTELELEALCFIQVAGKHLMRFGIMPTYLPKDIKLGYSPAEALALMRLCMFLDLQYHDEFLVERNDLISQIARQGQGIRGFSQESVDTKTLQLSFSNA